MHFRAHNDSKFRYGAVHIHIGLFRARHGDWLIKSYEKYVNKIFYD